MISADTWARLRVRSKRLRSRAMAVRRPLRPRVELGGNWLDVRLDRHVRLGRFLVFLPFTWGRALVQAPLISGLDHDWWIQAESRRNIK
jgi:hypothetical protein